ncbi:MAG: HAMP domain-containing sensor histidine kinase [Bdellovibrionota bacterium]
MNPFTSSSIKEMQSYLLEQSQSFVGNNAIIDIRKNRVSENTELIDSDDVDQFLIFDHEGARYSLNIYWKDVFSSAVTLKYLLHISYLLFFLLIGYTSVVVFQYRWLFLPLLDKVTSLQKEAGILKIVQMVAHDIRKPFMVCHYVINNALEACTDETFKKQLSRGMLEFEKVRISAENLVSEILNYNVSQSHELFDSSSIDDIIESALYEVLESGILQKDLDFKVDLKHKRKIFASSNQLQRVIVNLIANAIEASRGEGSFWIQTYEEERRGNFYVVFCIGNSHGFILDEKKHMIFDSFYSDKPNGIGLGLAIAKKIVSEHGGKIWFTSSKNNGTEFFFEIKAVKNEVVYPRIFSLDSLYNKTNSMDADEEFYGSEFSLNERLLEGKFIVFIDDSIFFFEEWQRKLSDNSLKFYLSPESFLKDVNEKKIISSDILCVITDYYFKNNSRYTGELLAVQLRNDRRFDGIPIFLSSEIGRDIENNIFDGILSKEPLDWSEVKLLLYHKLA